MLNRLSRQCRRLQRCKLDWALCVAIAHHLANFSARDLLTSECRSQPTSLANVVFFSFVQHSLHTPSAVAMAAFVTVWPVMAGFSNNGVLAGEHNSMAGRSSVMNMNERITTYSDMPNEWKLPAAAMAKIMKVDGHRHGHFWPFSVRRPGACLAGVHNSMAGRTSVMSRSARITKYSGIPEKPKLPRAAMLKIQKVDGHRHGRFWPIRVTRPGTGQTDSEEPSDINNESTKVADNPKKPANTESSESADRPFRCRAAITACPFPPRPGPLPWSFSAESVNGDLVKCSGRGCQPVYANVLAQYFQLYYTAASLKEVDKNAVKTAFDASLECSPNDYQLVSMYASFTWRLLRNIPAADYLYRKAIKLSPHDPCVVEPYCFFICSGLYCTLSCRFISECGLLVFVSRSARQA